MCHKPSSDVIQIWTFIEGNIENFIDQEKILLKDFVYRKIFKAKIEKVINRRNQKEKATIGTRDK